MTDGPPPSPGTSARARGGLRDFLWPRMGMRRYLRYLVKRVLRLQATPHAIGAGVASGAAVSMFPLIGLHFLLGFVLAFITRGNMIAAAIGTAWGNPLTFPIFFSTAYAVGSWILGEPSADGVPAVEAPPPPAVEPDGLIGFLARIGVDAALPAFKTMMVGAIPNAILVYLVFYVLFRWLTVRARIARQRRRAAARG